MDYTYGFGGEFYLIAIVFAVISMIVSQRLKSKFKTYSKIQLRNGLSGAEIAEKMLADHGIRIDSLSIILANVVTAILVGTILGFIIAGKTKK